MCRSSTKFICCTVSYRELTIPVYHVARSISFWALLPWRPWVPLRPSLPCLPLLPSIPCITLDSLDFRYGVSTHDFCIRLRFGRHCLSGTRCVLQQVLVASVARYLDSSVDAGRATRAVSEHDRIVATALDLDSSVDTHRGASRVPGEQSEKPGQATHSDDTEILHFF